MPENLIPDDVVQKILGRHPHLQALAERARTDARARTALARAYLGGDGELPAQEVVALARCATGAGWSVFPDVADLANLAKSAAHEYPGGLDGVLDALEPLVGIPIEKVREAALALNDGYVRSASDALRELELLCPQPSQKAVLKDLYDAMSTWNARRFSLHAGPAPDQALAEELSGNPEGRP